MANFSASSGVDSQGYHLEWTLAFDDAADTVTVDAIYTRSNGQAAPAPQKAEITVTLNTSVAITLNLLTGRLDNGAAFVQGSPGNMLNAGPKTRTGVRLKVSADRAALITFSTDLLPPA